MNEDHSFATGLNRIGASSKYIFRKTGEEVEVIAFGQAEDGARSEEDWVSFIDASGREHIKAHLTLQFDFKATDTMSSLFQKALSATIPTNEHLPWDHWRYELFKTYHFEEGYTPKEAVKAADECIDILRGTDRASSQETIIQ